MKERPILFTSANVLAILDDRKGQTRRIVKFPPSIQNPSWTGYDRILDEGGLVLYSPGAPCWNEHPPIKCPYGKPGDRLWVKETHWRYGKWRPSTASGKLRWRFVATAGHIVPVKPDQYIRFVAPETKPAREEHGWHKRPSLFMPRWTSRLTLEITQVRVERLNQISHDDSKAEGISDPRPKRCQGLDSDHFACCAEYPHRDYRARYAELWESIHGPGSFDDRWVWAVDFRRCA